MGYTHYFTRDKRNVGSALMFGRLALDAKEIIKQAKSEGIEICGADGFGSPEFREAYFAFNGTCVGHLDHESFWWQAMPVQPDYQYEYKKGTDRENEIFEFCKTAYKPYDAVVTAVLIRAKEIYGTVVEIYSDGNWDEWRAGRDLYERVFGEVAKCPFEQVAA